MARIVARLTGRVNAVPVDVSLVGLPGSGHDCYCNCVKNGHYAALVFDARDLAPPPSWPPCSAIIQEVRQ
jgi:hypothetical protein